MALTARSTATHAMTRECVKARRGPRTSQIPSSGSCQTDSTYSTSARSTRQALSSGSRPLRRAQWNVSTTSP